MMHQKLLTFCTAILVLVIHNNACPDGCSCSSHRLSVSCKWRKVKGFPRNIPSNTEKLTIKGDISSISPYDLGGFTELKELDLFAEPIANLHTESFKRLKKLEKLDFEGFKLPRISNGTFSSLSLLKSLKLRRNGIGAIESEAFAGLNSLVDLDLGENQLKNVDKIFDVNMPQLTRLSLTNNRITSIGKKSFHRLSNLKSLDISVNQLMDLQHESFVGLDNLQELKLGSNKIKYLRAKVFSSLTKLTLLWIGGNELFSMNKDSFSGLVSLKVLTLTYNKLMSLHKDIFSDLSNLDRIDLSDNKIDSLKEGTFSQLTKLKTICLDDNMISSIHRHMFTGLFLLETLHLRNNGLKYIEEGAFNSLVNVSLLVLSDNRLTELRSNMFNKMTKLRKLDISNNVIIKVDEDSFSSLTKMVELRMFGNLVNCSCSYIRMFRNVIRSGNAFANCMYSGHSSVTQKAGKMFLNKGALWSNTQWRVCNRHCDENVYIKTSSCLFCYNYFGYHEICSKVILPECMMLWYQKKEVSVGGGLLNPSFGLQFGMRQQFGIQNSRVSRRMEKLNETKPGECSLDQCHIPYQITKLLLNKSVTCLEAEKIGRKDEGIDALKNIFSNPVVLVSVVSLLPLLLIIILVYCCCSRRNDSSTRTLNATNTTGM